MLGSTSRLLAYLSSASECAWPDAATGEEPGLSEASWRMLDCFDVRKIFCVLGLVSNHEDL